MKEKRISRRGLLQASAGLSCMAMTPLRAVDAFATDNTKPEASANPIKPPAAGSIPVAFLISDGAVVIDFCGPWEVFSDFNHQGRSDWFRAYTVSENAKAIVTSGGMKIIPDYTIQTAPTPKVIVIPAQSNHSKPVLDWVRTSSQGADVTMSVCTGAYLLAKTGLLSGKSATTHHASYVDLAKKFPDIRVERGVRYVEDGNLASSGGLSCGIDLAFRVVERYFGREAADQHAYDMEYQGDGWKHPELNEIYTKMRASTDEKHFCAVCGMDTDPKTAPSSLYENKKYYFCSPDHKAQFDASPKSFVKVS